MKQIAISHNKPLNSNNPEDAEAISKMLEDSDEEDEENEDYTLYLSDDKKIWIYRSLTNSLKI